MAPSLAETAVSLEQSLARIEEVASAKQTHKLSQKEKALIEEIVGFGPEALPDLMELMDDEKRAVTVVTAEAIEEIVDEMDTLDEKFLPAILQGLEHDHSGLLNVLAKIRTPAARRAYLSHYLIERSLPDNQLKSERARLGADKVITVIESDGGVESRRFFLMGAALGSFTEEDGRLAASELLKVFFEKETTLERRKAILVVISELGPAALGVEEEIITIWENEEDLKDEAAQALIGIGSKKAGQLLGEQLKASPDIYLLRDIAEKGVVAEGAGTEVAKLLESSDWDLRLGAARTLGFIGFRGADERLMELLGNPVDVRLNYVAAESLGRLKSDASLEALAKTAENHWHSAVRAAAKKAVGKIQSASDYEWEYAPWNFASGYFDYQHLGVELPEEYRIPAIVEPQSLRALSGDDPKFIERLRYPREILSLATDEDIKQAAKSEDGKTTANGVTVVKEDNAFFLRKEILQEPWLGLRVPDGWLLGGSRGEWGGEIVFKGEGDQYYEILKDNVIGLFTLGERIIAVTGLAHLTLNSGLIYELKLVDGKWRAERWRALPGAPQSVGKLQNGEIMVATEGGGGLVLSEDGVLRMVELPKKPKDEIGEGLLPPFPR